jgi:hypothetical protein
MGKRSLTANEEAKSIAAGTFSAAGAGTSPLPFIGNFNVTIWGTFVGTVQLERSFDGGATWIVAAKDTSGTAAAYTAPCSLVCSEPESGVIYRLNCTAYTSGTVSYRISQ